MAVLIPCTSALTDPLISGIAKGSTAYKLVGSYVTTPLNWQVLCLRVSDMPSSSALHFNVGP